MRLEVRDRLRALARSPRAWLVSAALLLRVLWIVFVPSRPVGDFALYREAAEYLADQGQLDPEFVYMPGYVMMLAAVRTIFGSGAGGLLAAKMIGVLSGVALVIAAGEIATRQFGRRAGLVATAVTAVWPAGIAVTSVTGTDLPAGALGSLAVLSLVRFAPHRPWRAVIVCGALFGLAAWVRALFAPLGALCFFYWRASGVRFSAALTRSGATLAVAFLVLLPWALRNRSMYGELLFTDSHGGNTALVGANPNSEGTYSRSLNAMFLKGTGYQVFETPARHRQSDRAAFQLARRWTAFEPIYAVGLVIAKADRLLGHERNLLYWPLFRPGVLDDGHRRFFSAHRWALERATDCFWWAVAALAAAGIGLCLPKRDWTALSLALFPLALTAIYTVLFAEVRYHLAIVPLLIPFAGCAVDWAWTAAGDRFRGQRRSLIAAGGAVAVVFVGALALVGWGVTLRATHRWAVTVCAYPSAWQTHLCEWRRGAFPAGGESPIRGSWDGVGIAAGRALSAGVTASAGTLIPVGKGRFRVRALVSFAGDASTQRGLAVALRAGDRVIGRVRLAGAGQALFDAPTGSPFVPGGSAVSAGTGPGSSAVIISGEVEGAGEGLPLEVQVESEGIGSIADGRTIWISHLVVERF